MALYKFTLLTYLLTKNTPGLRRLSDRSVEVPVTISLSAQYRAYQKLRIRGFADLIVIG